MLNSGNAGGRGEGVRMPQHGTTVQNAVQKVASLVPLQFFACQYVDANGKEHSQMVAFDGQDSVYFIGTEKEAKELKIAAPWLRDQVKARIGTRKPGEASEPLPKEDAVDVVAPVTSGKGAKK